MPSFRYEAKRTPTDRVTGTVVAEEKKNAVEQLSRLGYYVVSVEETDVSVASDRVVRPPVFFRQVSLKETTNFSRELADLLESGIPIVRALDILQEQTSNKVMKSSLQDIREQCVAGSGLSQALSRHPRIFSELFVILTRAGETAGALDQSLRRLSEFSERQLEIRRKIQAAMAYPVLMAVVGVGTVLVLLIFVIPRMVGIFEDLGQSLPLPTQILLWTSALFTRHFGWLALAFSIFIWGVLNFFKTFQARLWLDQVKLKLPVLGPLIQKIEVGRFAHTLATLLGSGVSTLEALGVSVDTVGNRTIKNELNACSEAVKTGGRLSAALSAGRVIPFGVVQMIAVGEESGRLEKTLQKISENYEREADQSIKVLMSLLEPLMILVLGLIVGFMVVAILLPVFEISLSAK